MAPAFWLLIAEDGSFGRWTKPASTRLCNSLGRHLTTSPSTTWPCETPCAFCAGTLPLLSSRWDWTDRCATWQRPSELNGTKRNEGKSAGCNKVGFCATICVAISRRSRETPSILRETSRYPLENTPTPTPRHPPARLRETPARLRETPLKTLATPPREP